MEKSGGSTCRCSNKVRCSTCKPGLINLGAALQELGSLSNTSSMVTEEQENMVRERRLRDSSRNFFDQSPPLWISHPSSSNGSLRVETELIKEGTPPLQPPNSPVSPQLPYEQFRLSSREGLSDPWEGRLLGGRRINMKGRQRMFSGPNGGSSGSSNGSGDRYAERMRERNISYRPYRIPRPKLLNMGSRLRTISATLHEEPESNRLAPILDSSPVSVTTDALRSMAIGENLGTTLLSKNEGNECMSTVNFPRSRSAENLERRAMDVAATTLDGVSDKIEKLHVT